MTNGNQRKDKDGVFEILPQAIVSLKKNIIDPFLGDGIDGKRNDESLPLRSELFTEEQLEQHAITLAQRHRLTTAEQTEQLLKRLASNEEILLDVHNELTESVKKNARIFPAAEWLLDNFYLI